MTVFQAFILGVIQGLTEFLPVSSSGHLVLAQELFGISHGGDISFEVFVHFGTLLSVLAAFWKDVVGIASALIAALKNPRGVVTLFKNSEHLRLGVFIVVGTIPAAFAGVRFEHQVDVLFDDPKLVSVMLMITAFILFLSRFANPPSGSDVGLGSSIIVGIMQAVAILPGISRSGLTISSGLMCGISRENSARFSFLLALPIILGATFLKVGGLIAAPPKQEVIVASFVVVLISSKTLESS